MDDEFKNHVYFTKPFLPLIVPQIVKYNNLNTQNSCNCKELTIAMLVSRLNKVCFTPY